MCTLPKPPAGRALSEGKEAPQAAFPNWCFPAQTKRRTEGIRVPVPLAWLLQVYFSSSAFSQKVSRKQLRGSFINVSCLPRSAQALRSFCSSRHGGGQGRVRRCLLPGARRDEKGKPEGSPHPWRGVRLPQVSDGDALTLVLPTPLSNSHHTDGGRVEPTSGKGHLAMGWPR